MNDDGVKDVVLVSRAVAHPHVAVITINQPHKRNAFSRGVRETLLDVLQRLMHADESCRAVVLTGAGNAFCAGGDISEMQERSVLQYRQIGDLPLRIFELIACGPKPVVAAVHGPAMGAGLSLATVCDRVVATPQARFCAAFVKVGMLPDTGLYWSLGQRVGQARARELMLSGCDVSSAEGLRIGLVDEITEPDSLLDRACTEAAQLGCGNTTAQGLLRDVVANGSTSSFRDVMRTECHLRPLLARPAKAQAAAASSADDDVQPWLEVERCGDAAIVRARKPMRDTTRWVRELSGALDAVQQLELTQCRAIVLSGAVCGSGNAELDMRAELLPLQAAIRERGCLIERIRCFDRPVIAVLEGDTSRVGLALAMAADLVVASPEARLHFDEAVEGDLPGDLLLWSLPAKVGLCRARGLWERGSILRADDPEARGVVDELAAASQVSARALEIAHAAPLAGRDSVAAFRAGVGSSIDLSESASLPLALRSQAAGRDGTVAIRVNNHVGTADLSSISSDASNALEKLMHSALADVTGVRVLVVKGLEALNGGDSQQAIRKVVDLIVKAPFPVIGVATAACVGSAVAVALACDFLYAGSDARFSFSLPTDPLSARVWGFVLARRTLPGTARRLALFSATLTARAANDAGLLTAFVEGDDPSAAAHALAGRLLKLPPLTVGILKQALDDGSRGMLLARQLELDLPPLARRTRDHKEAISAFMEKRTPQFNGT